ncbi:DUF6907 domain-containing protein [Streptomyces sp. NPDC058664]|uniref:DUF6907 domain-containing protein n=1 Tax=unclassified Streptomyces TaxID=2593676 RepID=UPI003647AF24
MTEPTALYRLFDAHDRLLYIGITKNLEQRWTGHRYSATSSTWWPEVARKAIEWYPTREAADKAETAAILSEAPLHNKDKAPGSWGSKRTAISPELDWSRILVEPYSQQAARILSAELEAGAVQPGNPMPTTKDLHRRFGLSVATCGAVLQILADRGLVHQRGKGGRYYRSRPGEAPPRQLAPSAERPTERDVATELQAITVEGIPVEVVERRRRNRRWPRTVLGAHLQMHPYSLDPAARQPHVNVELAPNEVVELDAEGLAAFVDQLEAQCAALRELQDRLERVNHSRRAA